MRIFITGGAGFIGFHLAHHLLRKGIDVIALDSFTPYYDVSLKRERWAILTAFPHFQGIEADLCDALTLTSLIAQTRPTYIIHLAAQAGVRYSLEEPRTYVETNCTGTFNLLEAVRAYPVTHLLIASTSSVYGGNSPPFSEDDRTDHPVSFYAATKKATEAMAHSYAYLWNQPISALRFFTVYGPWGRPDMALFRFTQAILSHQPLELYNGGQMARDFTYIDDVVESIERLMPCIPVPSSDLGSSPIAPFRAINIATGRSVPLDAYITAIEAATGHSAQRLLLQMQKGDVRETLGKIDLLTRLTGFQPATPLEKGVQAFVDWYKIWMAKKVSPSDSIL